MVLQETISGSIWDRSGGLLAELSNANVIQASSKRQCCPDGSFAIGGVYASTLSIACRIPNTSNFKVRGAKITLYSQYTGETNPYCIGTFWVTSCTRSGDIYTITAQDAVGWLDTASYNSTSNQSAKSVGELLNEQVGYTGSNLMTWCHRITSFANDFIKAQTGMSNLLEWEQYFPVLNDNEDYCNSCIWANINGVWRRTIYTAMYFLDSGTGTSNSACPRDFFKYIAELAGGFIFSKPEDGHLTLGQFAQPQYGEVAIGMDEIEWNSCDIADYTMELMRVDAHVELEKDQNAWGWWVLQSPDYDTKVQFRVEISNNPFLDGFAKEFVFVEGYSLDTVAQGIRYAICDYAGGYTIRPFSCTVHSNKRYALGQKVKLTYQDLTNASPQTYSSIITSIAWTFRGGHKISCGGSDSRAMADTVRMTKADKVRAETRCQLQALRKEFNYITKADIDRMMSS